MSDSESYEKLLPSGKNRSSESRSKKVNHGKAANALFFGVVLGFIFSFLVAYSGLVNESTSVNYSIYDFMSKSTNDSEVSETVNLAEYLKSEVRVLCAVMTDSGAIKQRGFIIMDTWGKRCNKLIFFSDKLETNFTNIVVTTEKDNFGRLREAFKYIYSNSIDEFDWILKTNDDSFIVLENLRHLLYQYDTEWPLIIGQRFLKEDYMVGDYALSKRAFTRLLEDAFTNEEICELKSGDSDKSIAACLEHVNVIKVDGVDDEGRGRFFVNNPESALFPEKFDDYDKWYWHKLKQGIDHCCSDRLIALQNFRDTHLYYLEYFIYKVHTFGRHRKREPLPKKLTLEEIVKNNY